MYLHSAFALLFTVTNPLNAEDPIANDCDGAETPGVEVTTESPTRDDIDYSDLVYMFSSCTIDDNTARWAERNMVWLYEHTHVPSMWYDDKVSCKTGGALQYDATFLCGSVPYTKRTFEEYNLIYENKNETPKYVEKERFEKILNHYKNTTKISREDLIIPDGAEPLVIGARWKSVRWPWIGNISAIPMSDPYKHRNLLLVIGSCGSDSGMEVWNALDKAMQTVLGFVPRRITFNGGSTEKGYRCPGGEPFKAIFWTYGFLTDAHVAALLDFNIISGHESGPPKVLSDEYYRKAEGILRGANVATVGTVEKLPGATALWPVGVYFTKNESEFFPMR